MKDIIPFCGATDTPILDFSCTSALGFKASDASSHLRSFVACLQQNPSIINVYNMDMTPAFMIYYKMCLVSKYFVSSSIESGFVPIWEMPPFSFSYLVDPH